MHKDKYNARYARISYNISLYYIGEHAVTVPY